MKRVLISLIVLATATTFAKEEIVQSGTPAKLTAANGKQAKVFLQKLENGQLTFQPFKSTKDMTVPADKIKYLEFFPKYDAVAVSTDFNEANYEGVLAVLEPAFAEFGPYMVIDSNLRDAYLTLFESYKGVENFAKVSTMAEQLIATGNEDLIAKSKVAMALAAIHAGNFEKANAIRGELSSEAASLYLKACIERAQGQPTAAIQTVSVIIAEHANDVEWMPQSELLNVYLYLDMSGTNYATSTNSVIYTARQVKNIYAGSNVAGDAKKVWISLGGDVIEAEEEARKAELKALREAEKKRIAEEKKAARAKKKAEQEAAKAAAEAAANETNTTSTTESE